MRCALLGDSGNWVENPCTIKPFKQKFKDGFPRSQNITLLHQDVSRLSTKQELDTLIIKHSGSTFQAKIHDNILYKLPVRAFSTSCPIRPPNEGMQACITALSNHTLQICALQKKTISETEEEMEVYFKGRVQMW